MALKLVRVVVMLFFCGYVCSNMGELYVDGEFVYSQRSDGLIAAALSSLLTLTAGGPLICLR